MPEMNAFFTELDGKPAVGHPEHINLGIAIDLAKEDGSRQLLVPSIKGCEAMDFGQFWSAYEATVKKARNGALTVEDFAGTTVSLTNPGTIGTVHSVPRLVQGQGLILGVGAMDYPAEFQGASEETLTKLGISKVVTLTSTYEHSRASLRVRARHQLIEQCPCHTYQSFLECDLESFHLLEQSTSFSNLQVEQLLHLLFLDIEIR